jgi:hypothetical protein
MKTDKQKEISIALVERRLDLSHMLLSLVFLALGI